MIVSEPGDTNDTRAGKSAISTAGGLQPRWGRDDKETGYLSLDGN